VLLRALSTDGAATVFPSGAPFGLVDRARADFLVLDANPLTDFTAIERIRRRVKAGQELDFLSGLQSNLGKAFQLADDQTFRDDPSYTFRVGYAKTQAVTAADVKRVANKYLGAARIVLSNVPIGKRELASHADRSTIVTDPLTERTTEIKP